MMSSYAGPLRDEPLSIELHNTIYASGGEIVDGLGDPASAEAFAREIADRCGDVGLPDGPDPIATELVGLREIVRVALRAVVDGIPVEAPTISALNAAAARAPISASASLTPSGDIARTANRYGASRAEVLLAAFATDAIDLLTGPARTEIRACRAPGCVLLYLRDHPRRRWCSQACGNRARQARHYRRTHQADET